MTRTLRTGSLLLAATLLTSACGGDADTAAPSGEATTGTPTETATSDEPTAGDATPTEEATVAEGTTVQLVTHDSFNVSEDVLADFTETTGIEVEVLRGGDAGQVVNQAVLSAGNPQGDVLFGVDNTLLSRALDEDVFVPYEAEGLDAVDPDLVLDGEHRVTPIDRGDVCLNYDKAAFAGADVPVPETLEDLTDPAYAGDLVVENPATSSPGLAFLLATVAEFGEDGWLGYWEDLVANDVAVSSGWEDAYYGRFSGAAGSEGDRPLVVSYASSPPAEVIFAEEELDEAPTGVIADSCFQQIEFAGVLDGTDAPEAARRLVDFMLSEAFQADIPLQMFVFPARGDVELPQEFTEYTVVPDDPVTMDPARIDANREEWIEQWTRTVLG
jgi:thiamine transport system substrate-binding protein